MSRLIVSVALFLYSTSGVAQVYQSQDEQGNPVFSDKPSAGAKAVKVPEPNLGDSIEVPPAAPEPVPVEKPVIEGDREPS